jgi:hypothetical protein
MPHVMGFRLLAALAIAASATAQADELDRLRGTQPDTSGQGMHSDFYDQPIGRFMDLLAAGAITEARPLQPQVCAAWKADRSQSAWTGDFSIGGVPLSLDRLCGLAPPPHR